MTEENPLPLARMVTINKPSFWIFIGACMLLYIYNKTITPDNGDRISYIQTGFFVWIAAFVGLFMNLIAGSIKNNKASRAFHIICYVFEIASVIVLGLMIIIK